jgi:hypothetical protein
MLYSVYRRKQDLEPSTKSEIRVAITLSLVISSQLKRLHIPLLSVQLPVKYSKFFNRRS